MKLTRRSFFGVAGSVVLGAAAFALPGCGESRSSVSASAASDSAASASAQAASEASSAAASAAASAQSSSASASAQSASSAAAVGGNALVIYFSRADENYGVGYIEEGNTAIVAKMIAQETGADMFEIVPTNAYPEGYDECCDVAKAEQDAGERPAYDGDIDIAAYDTIYLGYPIWWGDLPMCVYTFLEAHDWNGKSIHPFCTHAGSGLSGTEAKIQSTCAGSTVQTGLSMEGTTAQDARDEAQAAVSAWLV